MSTQKLISSILPVVAVGTMGTVGLGGYAQAADLGLLTGSDTINFAPVQIDFSFLGEFPIDGGGGNANFFDVFFDTLEGTSNFQIATATGAFSSFSLAGSSLGTTHTNPFSLPAGVSGGGGTAVGTPLPTDDFIVLDPGDVPEDAFKLTQSDFPASFTLENNGGATVQLTTNGMWTQGGVPIYNGSFTYTVPLVPTDALDGNGFQSVEEIQDFLESSPENQTVTIRADATEKPTDIPEPTTLGGLGLLATLGLLFNKNRKKVA